MEKGERQAKAEEIIKLAGNFGRGVHAMVRPCEPVVEWQPHLWAVAERMKDGDDEGLVQAIGRFQQLADDYRELERIMGPRFARTTRPKSRWIPVST